MKSANPGEGFCLCASVHSLHTILPPVQLIMQGKANVTCRSGCSCMPSVINAHHTYQNSQLQVHNVPVSQV